ncbi:hypothetical protein BDZ91DRAFT_195802 [Kalaharituber pfeilii]|nr:hypothetical protein BDZ91DRAFT_195802 [Kalaharituber pfeilii]
MNVTIYLKIGAISCFFLVRTKNSVMFTLELSDFGSFLPGYFFFFLGCLLLLFLSYISYGLTIAAGLVGQVLGPNYKKKYNGERKSFLA